MKINNIAGDYRFDVIELAKKDLKKYTNIGKCPDEMKVLDDTLYRCWQMGWLDKYYIKALEKDNKKLRKYQEEQQLKERDKMLDDYYNQPMRY